MRARRLHEVEHGGALVVQMYPAHPLRARPQRPAQIEPQGRQERGQRPAALAKHQTGADDDAAHAHGFHGRGRGLPGHGGVGQKARARRRGFVEQRVAPAAVIAYGRCLDQDARLVRGKAHGLGHGLARFQARGEDAQFLGRGPALPGNAFARQVDDRIRTVHHVDPQGLERGRLPGNAGHAAAQCAGAAVRIAGRNDHLVAVVPQQHGELPADKPCAANNDSAHDTLLWTVRMQ